MPVRFRILPDIGLVYVHYSGIMRMAETLQAFGAYAVHPDRRPGQKQLVDLRDITGSEMDFPALMRLQAEKADVFYRPDTQTLIAYIAECPETIRIGHFIQRSWDAIDGVIACVFTTAPDALNFLGLAPSVIEDLSPETR